MKGIFNMKNLIHFLVLICCLICSIYTPPQTTFASSSVSPAPDQNAASITYYVKKGDTLSGIAARYGVSLSAIMQANGLTRYVIYVGQRLLIPVGSTNPAPQPGKPATSNTSKSIYISINQQRMYVYENGSMKYTFPVSTGSAGRATLTGNFRVKTRLPNAWGGTWRIWMPYWLGIYDVGRFENGIHAVPYREDGTKLWEGWIGRPVSYGCVVLRTADATQLYSWANLGTPVIIRY
jgi:lipoprotein-anchoring transpeptidase ErfK/SrfK